MKLNLFVKRMGNMPLAAILLTIIAGLALTACSGGGGSALPEPEAVVTSVAVSDQKLEGQTGATTLLEFVVTTNKPVVRGLVVSFNTLSTSKTGVASTGSAVGGVVCGAGVDFVAASGSKITIPAGVKTSRITVEVCSDDAFEPNETLQVAWSSEGATGGTLSGTIVNDDAGGLNSTGATKVMGLRDSFGRDGPNLLSVAGTPLGFSFDTSDPTNGTQCIVDRVTGLTWQRSFAVQTSDFSGSSAFATTANTGAGLCGQTNWRVPTVNELLSLMNMSKTVAPFNADLDAMAGGYWSSEEVTTATGNAWVVSAAQGGPVTYENKTTTANVRLVSGGAYSVAGKFSNASACNDSTRYKTDFSDGTVEDTKTGLMWKQCAEGATGSSCSFPSPTAFSSATNILARLDAVNAAPASLGLGYADWRIPTVKELASLVDRCTGTTLAIDSTVFPNNQSISYVSASYDANNDQQFWYVNFFEGTVAVATPANKYLRLVRAGQ